MIIWCALLLQACNEKPVDRNAYKEELENRKIVRANEGQVTQIAQQKGARLLDSIFKAFEIYTASRSGKNWTCNLDSLEVVPYIAKEYGIRTAKIGLWNTDTSSLEGQVLQAYSFADRQKEVLEINLQRKGIDTFMITKPWIWQKETVCASCHTISSSKNIAILALYMPKKELIKSITAKDLKTLPQP